jgi:hypothetical protein
MHEGRSEAAADPNASAKTLPMVPVLSFHGHNNDAFQSGHRRLWFRKAGRRYPHALGLAFLHDSDDRDFPGARGIASSS